MTYEEQDTRKKEIIQEMERMQDCLQKRLKNKKMYSWMSLSAMQDDLFYLYATAKQTFENTKGKHNDNT